MSCESFGEDWAEVPACRGGEPSKIVGIRVVERVQAARDPGIETAVLILADEVLGDTLPAAAACREHECDGGDRPVRQAAGVQSFSVVGR